MQALNLLPADLRPEERPFLSTNIAPQRARQGAVAAVAVAVVAVGGLYLHARSSVHGKKSDLSSVQAQLATVQAKVDAIQAVQSKMSGRLVVLRTVTGTRMNWDNTLADLARVLPGEVFLTSLQASSPVPAAVASVSTTPGTTPGTTFTIAGVAPSSVRIALVLDRLALVPWLSDITLQSATRQTDGTDVFTIGGTVVGTTTPTGGTGS
jgi:Tfp pilus assembly protein PilN